MFYFLVYNDNTHTRYLHKLIASVRKYGKQFEIIVFDKHTIDKEFALKHESILSLERGGGHWLWKPYIINETMNKINENDMVFYLDSKYFFTEEFSKLYSEHIEHNDLVVWKNKPNEPTNCMKYWCKMDVVLKYDMSDKVYIENAEDCWAGAIIVKKTINSVKYIQEWLGMCCIYENITDSPSSIEHAEFRDHRHDQSLLSIITHKYNINTHFFENRYLQNCRIPYRTIRHR